MKQSTRFLCLALILFSFALLSFTYTIYFHVQFERFLNSDIITFEDFDPSYSQALVDFVSKNESKFEFDYTSYPISDPSISIPPIIHYIWFKDLYPVRAGGSQIAHAGSNAPEYCKYRHQNQNFTLNIWDAADARRLLEENYAWFLPTYDGYVYPIQRVDAFKYFLLWHFGGVYIDMDISCRRSLLPLLQFPAWFPRASPFGVNNDILAARARHPVIGRMTETLRSRDKNLLLPWLTVFWSTGPRYTTDILKTWFHERIGRTNTRDFDAKRSDPDAFYVLPQMFYSEEYTFFGHRTGGTWYGSDVAVVLWFLARPWIAQLLALAAAVLCLCILVRSSSLMRCLMLYKLKWRPVRQCELPTSTFREVENRQIRRRNSAGVST